ncbi:MAG: hypothetical protein WCH98_11675 [Verrucomicrobiota bacterium]
MKPRSSLPSLLTLAAGASALPLAAEAGIVYTSLGAQTVGFGGGQLTVYDIYLPGTAAIEFARNVGSASATHRILVHQSGGYVRIGRQADHRSEVSPGYGGINVAFRTNSGANWDYASRTGQATFGNIVRSVNSGGTVLTTGPGAFSNKYLFFSFKNSSSGNQLQYGWVGMSSTTVTAGTPANMSVTLTDWAYDDTGAKIIAGAIPEPGSAALAMGGALVLGAAGLRQWRKRKAATAKSVGDLIAS